MKSFPYVYIDYIDRCVSDSLRLLRRMLQTPFLSKTQLSNA